MKIQDGSGKGYEAQVDDHGRLFTRSNIISHTLHHATFHKDLFLATGGLTTADGNEAPLLFIRNDENDKDLEIHKVTISSDSNVLVKMYTGGVYSSGGTAVSPVNTNLSSTISRDVTILSGGTSDDLVITTTNQDIMWQSYIAANSMTDFNWDGALVMPFTKSLHFTVQGVASDLVTITIEYAWHKAGTTL